VYDSELARVYVTGANVVRVRVANVPEGIKCKVVSVDKVTVVVKAIAPG
jgi:hypothetical protein